MASRTIVVKIETKGAKETSDDVKKVAKSTRNLGTETKKTDAQLKRHELHLKRSAILSQKLATETRRTSQIQNGLTKSFIKGNLASRAISKGLAVLTGTFRVLTSSAIEFEDTFTRLAILSGTSSAELDNLKKKMIGVALNSPKTVAELASAGLEMSKLGFNSKEVSNALETVTHLSVVMGEDMRGTAEALVNVKNVFGQSASAIEKNGETLLAVFSNTALNLAKFRTSFSFVGKAADLAKVSFEDTAATMGILSSAGIRASTVGTQMRQVFIRLSDKSSKAGKAIGGTNIQTIGYREALKRLAPMQNDVTKLVDTFGIRAAGVASSLILNREKIMALSDATSEYKGLLDKANSESMKTFAGRINQMISSLGVLGVTIGDSWLGGLFKGLLSLLTLLTRGFTGFIKSVGLGTRRWIEFAKVVRGSLSSLRSGDFKGFMDSISDFELSDELSKKIIELNKERENIKKSFSESFSTIGDDSGMTELLDKINTIKKKLEGIKKGINTEGLKDITSSSADSKSDIDRMIENFDLLTLRAKFFQDTIDPEIVSAYIDELLEFQQKFQESGDLKGEGKALNALAKATGGGEKGSLKTMKDDTMAMALANDSLTVSFNALSSSIDALGDAFVNSALRGGEAWNNFGTVMGDILKQMVAQLISAIIKLLVFKAITAALSAYAGGPVANMAVGVAASAFSQQVPQAFQQKKAQGMNSMVTKPTNLMVGESGPEDVIIKPRSKSSSVGSGNTIQVNINGDVFGAEKFTEAVRVAQDKLNRDLV